MSPSKGAALRRENKELKSLLNNLMKECSPQRGEKLTTITALLRKETEFKNQAKNEIWHLKENIEQIIMERDVFLKEVDRLKIETTLKMVKIKEKCEGRRDVSAKFLFL